MKTLMQEPISYGRTATECHMCRSKRLFLVLDLGHQPHSDFFPTGEELQLAEVFYPLRLVACRDCGLLQIDYFVNPTILYQQNYLYQSSTTATGRKHYVDMAQTICKKFEVAPGSLVIDVGSNVGVLLGGFKEAGMKVLGVDPAPNIAAIANEAGIETIADFFGSTVAKNIKEKYGLAGIITGTNVFAHLHELDDAVAGMKLLLAEDGVIVIEAPHALPLIEHLEYDTIYHQHIAYLAVRPMQKYFNNLGLELFDVEELPIHGGSLRYFVGYPGNHVVSTAVERLLLQEERAGLYREADLANFARKVEEQKYALVELILSLKKQGKRIVALSAPAKGNTLLNYCHLDRSYIDYATEKNPLKVGRYTPGTHIPIYADEHLLEYMPDYALILAWNFSREIMSNMQEFKDKGGKFIIPIPTPQII